MPWVEGFHPPPGGTPRELGHFWGLFRPLHAPRVPTSGFSLYDCGVCREQVQRQPPTM